jgi:serine/threonine-protein kinase RsbW
LTPPIQIEIEVKSDLQAVDLVLLQFNNIYHSTILQQDWLQCQLALVEGFTNAIRHAHKNLPLETPIIIQIALDTEKMTIRIWDYGNPFNLEHFIAKVSKNNRSWPESGKGIAIMYKIADILRYDRVSATQNCLLIVKYFVGSRKYRSAQDSL